MSWYLYDLANQLYPFIVVSFVFNPWLVEELGGRDWMYTVTFALSMLVALASAPVVGAVADRIGRRPVLISTTLVAVVSIGMLGIGRLLGLPVATTVILALVFFGTSNLGFQLGVVAYDAFLPGVSSRTTLGRVGGFGIAAGYMGSVLALALMILVLEVLDLGEPVLFLMAGGLFLLIALPAFVFLRDPGAHKGEPLRDQIRDAARSTFDGIRALPKDPVLSRFLLTRFFYADAINTLILVMGVYAITEIGFERNTLEYYLLLGLGILFAVLSAPLWGMAVDRIGPRHTLVFALTGWALVFVVVVVHPVLGLPRGMFYLIGALVGVFLAGTWTSDRPLLVGMAPPKRVGEWFGLYALAGRFAAITGPLTWAFVVDVLFAGAPGARQFGVLSILATMLVALVLLQKLPDPFVPGPSPAARIVPWGDGSGRRLQRLWRLPVKAPFVLLYLVVTWILFFFALSPQPDPDPGVVLEAQPHLLQGFHFDISDPFDAPHRALLSLLTAPWVNVHLVQLVYVSVLLLLFGVVFEVREGTPRVLVVFFSTSAFGALFASFLHQAVYPGVLDHSVLEQAERSLWTGGSAGAFGLMGALAARARVAWPLFAFFVFWEVNVGWWFLQSFTPAFHLSALFAGFLLARYVLGVKVPPRASTAPGE